MNTTAPVWFVEWEHSRRCWACKRVRRSGTEMVAFGCELFPGHSMCSEACARSYIVHDAHLCEAERSQLLLDLTEWVLDTEGAGGDDIATGGTPPARPWWRFPDFAMGDVASARTIDVGEGWTICTRMGLHDVLDQDSTWCGSTANSRATRINTRTKCWGCFQSIPSAPCMLLEEPIEPPHRVAYVRGRFCDMRCVRLFLWNSQMLAPRKGILLKQTYDTMDRLYGGIAVRSGVETTRPDWQLHEDFGGPLSDAVFRGCAVRLRVYRFRPCATGRWAASVTWVMRSVSGEMHRGVETEAGALERWVVAGAKDEHRYRMSGGELFDDGSSEASVAPEAILVPDTDPHPADTAAAIDAHVKSIIAKLPPTDPDRLFWEARRRENDSRAMHYVRFRIMPLESGPAAPGSGSSSAAAAAAPGGGGSTIMTDDDIFNV